MKITKIISKNNEYIKQISKIKENDFNYFLLEGTNLIKEALKFNIVKQIFILDKHKEIFKNFSNVVILNKNVLDKISSVKNSNLPIALCYKKNTHKSKNKKILLLDHIQDPGNLGTIIRTAVAFEFDKIVISEESVSLYNQKVLRSTQGSFLYVEIIEKINLEKYIQKLKLEKNFIIGTFLNSDNSFSDNESLKNYKKITLLLGSEGNGINKNYLKYVDSNFKIKINKIESLNLAIAAGIIMYELSNLII